MARSKTTYTVVELVGEKLNVTANQTLEEASTLIARGPGAEDVLLFKGNPIPFAVETSPRVTIGAPKTRARKAKPVAEAAPAKKRGRPVGSKNKPAAEANGEKFELPASA
jgi:hypothetical protein